MEIITKSAAQTQILGRKIGNYLKQQAKIQTIKLYGNLGSGKTVLAKGIAQSLGLNKSDILSPTFTIIRSYDISSKFYTILNHIDLYRIKNNKELQELGIKDLINQDKSLTIIEWAEKIPEFTNNSIDVHIAVMGSNRKIIISGVESLI